MCEVTVREKATTEFQYKVCISITHKQSAKIKLHFVFYFHPEPVSLVDRGFQEQIKVQIQEKYHKNIRAI